MAIKKKETLIRIGSGAIYILITGLCTVLSWWTCWIMIMVTAGICCNEYLNMARNDGWHPYVVTGTIAAVAIPMAEGVLLHGNHVAASGLAVAFVASIVCLMRFFYHEQDSIVDVSITVFGYLYIGLTLGSFLLIRARIEGIEGGLLCLFILLSVWATDGFAYLGGSAWGKHKFAPKISPNKTWEGVICGMASGIVFWALIPLVCPNCGFGYLWAVLSAIFCGIAGIIGDLTESHMKRSFHTKDAGDMMPGHGGLLDRTDSLLFVSVVAYAMVAAAPYVFDFIGVVL